MTAQERNECDTSLWYSKEEDGQDLIEYALVIALIAFAATVGMTTVATKINTAFENIGLTMDQYVKAPS